MHAWVVKIMLHDFTNCIASHVAIFLFEFGDHDTSW